MATYQAPVRDMRFVLHDLLQVERRLAELPGYEQTTADIIDAVLEEAGKLCEREIFPTNRAGDEEGCTLADGQVTTPAGFKAAYSAFAEGGWTSLACDPEDGGQGLPETLNFFVEEMLCSANVAFSLYPVLSHGAYYTLRKHASEALRAVYLPKLADGSWAGSMCLTEAHSGSDLGLVRTRAVPADDGSYRLSGTKVFITGGDQDLTENIVHLVLARLPDAPAGTRGLSLFLSPKFLANPDGTLGERNAVACSALEHKMGIKGSSTCVINFDEAVGYLVGEANRGMATMFTMMNRERLAIGLQGLGLGEVAYQSAVEYARERRQGRAPGGAADPQQAADPIIVHPDVRRMLLTARAYNEAGRALAGWIALQIDVAEGHPDPAVREEAEDLLALLTPVVKAIFSDCGSEVCNLCLQVFGGHGYIAEWGMEQLVRDARIAQIYEGTNGIQALDLVRRKLGLHDGRLVKRYFRHLDGFVAESRAEGRDSTFTEPLAQAVESLREVTDWLGAEQAGDPGLAGAAATDYLRMMALVTYAWLWAWAAQVAARSADGEDGDFYQAKLATGRFFMQRLLPQVEGLRTAILSGSAPLMAMAPELF